MGVNIEFDAIFENLYKFESLLIFYIIRRIDVWKLLNYSKYGRKFCRKVALIACSLDNVRRFQLSIRGRTKLVSSFHEGILGSNRSTHCRRTWKTKRAWKTKGRRRGNFNQNGFVLQNKNRVMFFLFNRNHNHDTYHYDLSFSKTKQSLLHPFAMVLDN